MIGEPAWPIPIWHRQLDSGANHPEIEWRGSILWIAFDHDTVKAFGFGNISRPLSRHGQRKEFIRIVLILINHKHKLAVFVGTSLGLLDFETVARSGMEPDIG